MKRNIVVVVLGLSAAMVWGCGEIVGLPEGEWTTVCVTGTKECAGSTARACVDGAWQEESCAERACVDGACRGVCEPGKPRCEGLTAQTCTAQGEWPTGEVCPYVCSAGVCTGECVPGAPRCSPLSNTVQICVGGVWQDQTTCKKSTCDNGICNGVCAPDERECLEKTVRKCEGGTWVPETVCPYVCTAGMCSGECVPGTKRCSGNVPQECDASGAWFETGPCTTNAPRCEGGTCVLPPSCLSLPNTCGAAGNESCCAVGAVVGGTYNRSNDAAAPATVNDFQLDRFEITVGRFRRFVEAYPGSKPMAGAGAHPLIPASGWDAASNLPVDKAALQAAVKCSSSYQTWTDTAGSNENLPMNCLSWFESFAFCAWDGGRLPTEAEWNYAAAGGAEQRVYPWSNPASSTTIDGTYAVYNCQSDGMAGCTFADILKVGSKSPKGDGRWGHADLGGSMWEWNLDGFDTYTAQCTNCANILNISSRVIRGGSWGYSASSLLSSFRSNGTPDGRYDFVGARCARTP